MSVDTRHDQLLLINEIKHLELLPLLVDILQQANRSQLSVKDLNNAAGRIRVRLAKFKEILVKTEGLNQTPTQRKLLIDSLNYQIYKKKDILLNFSQSIVEKFGAGELDHSMDVEPQQPDQQQDQDNSIARSTDSTAANPNTTSKEIKQDSIKTRQSAMVNIANYLSSSIEVGQDELKNIIEENNSIALNEQKAIEEAKNAEEEQAVGGNKNTDFENNNNSNNNNNNNNNNNSIDNASDSLMDIDGQLGSNLDNDYMFMNDNLNLDGTETNLGKGTVVNNAEIAATEDASSNNNNKSGAVNDSNTNTSTADKILTNENNDITADSLGIDLLGNNAAEEQQQQQNEDDQNDDEKFFSNNAIDLNDFNLNDLPSGNGQGSGSGNEFGNFDDFGFDLDF